MSNTVLKNLKFQEKEVEVFNWEGEVLFNPYHVGGCLDIKDTKSSIRNFNEKQVIKLKNSDVRDMHFRKLNNAGENFLTESGVYKLIFQSHKKEAEEFQDWVTDEVLPSIRKHGAYISDNEENVDQGYIKYTYGQLGNTFSSCALENVDSEYKTCMEFHEDNNTRMEYQKSSKTRRCDKLKTHADSKITIMKKILEVITTRKDSLKSAGLREELIKLEGVINVDIKTIQHNKTRGKLAGKSR